MTGAQDKDAVKAYFDAEAARFDAIYDGANNSPLQAFVDGAFRTRMLRRRNDAIASLVDPGSACFEIGCGSGRTAVGIAASQRAEVHGIDIALAMIGLAEALARKAGVAELCRFEAADFDAFRPTRRYDVFVAVGVLDYFSDPLPMLRRAATEFAPGGRIVLSWSAKGMLLNPARKLWLSLGKSCPVYFYADADIARIAEALGGRLTKVIKSGLAPLIVDGMARIDL